MLSDNTRPKQLGISKGVYALGIHISQFFVTFPAQGIQDNILIIIPIDEGPVPEPSVYVAFQQFLHISMEPVRFAIPGWHVAVLEVQDDRIQMIQVRNAFSHPFPAFDIFRHLHQTILRLAASIVSDGSRILQAHVTTEFRIGVGVATFCNHPADEISLIAGIIADGCFIGRTVTVFPFPGSHAYPCVRGYLSAAAARSAHPCFAHDKVCLSTRIYSPREIHVQR